jgi:hypothetical protein
MEPGKSGKRWSWKGAQLRALTTEDSMALQPAATPPTLSTSTAQLGFLVAKAREFDVEVPPSGTEDGSDMADDRAVAALEDTPDNPAEQELEAALKDLNTDQLREVLALTWVGRGDYTAAEWTQALAQAATLDETRTPGYLMETPLLADLLETGLDELGYNITDDETP